jgi:hypothetical protein
MYPIVNYDGEEWKIVSQGSLRDGKIYCHLVSPTRGVQQKNGFRPVQIADWINQEAILAAHMRKEAFQREDQQRKFPVDQWNN